MVVVAIWNSPFCLDLASRSRSGSQSDHRNLEHGQTEGQINRLKILKRAMYGSRGVELLRALMLPIRSTEQHAD